MNKYKKNFYGFTIVELLVVIVIIGILAAITVVSYVGITKKATEASLIAELNNAKMQLSLFQSENDNYPETINCTIADSKTNKCIRTNFNTVDYQADNSSKKSFFLSISSGTSRFYITEESAPVATSGTSCPIGFINVPGSSIYETADFCVMKYEAKNNGSDIPNSVASGKPWVDVSQQTAISKAFKTDGCVGCHLITEREWLTIARNVLSVKENWSNGNIGDGYIYNGHNDSAPNYSLPASTDDQGYSGTGQSSGKQRRTLKLTNGETIWDMSGNVWEWTSGQITTGQPGITNAGYNWREWTEITNHGTISPDVSPKNMKLFSSENWNMNNGVGQIYSSSEETSLKGVMRGGDWGYGDAAGVLAIYLGDTPMSTGPHKGFRVAAP